MRQRSSDANIAAGGSTFIWSTWSLAIMISAARWPIAMPMWSARNGLNIFLHWKLEHLHSHGHMQFDSYNQLSDRFQHEKPKRPSQNDHNQKFARLLLISSSLGVGALPQARREGSTGPPAGVPIGRISQECCIF